MSKLVAVIFAVLMLVSCYKTEYSGTLNETGKVVDCFYTPAQITHTSAQTVSIGNSFGNSFDNNYGSSYDRRNNGVSIDYSNVTNEVPANYGVMFECEHKIKFVIQGSETKHKDLWSRMKKDSTVTIFYREIYHVDNKTGKKSLYDYDFLDAK